MPHVEYVCNQDGEVYLPSEPGDTHGERNDGSECGSEGTWIGTWYAPGEPHTLATHELEMPNCADPDCEFHHPEVLTTPDTKDLPSFEYPYGRGVQGPGTGPDGERLI